MVKPIIKPILSSSIAFLYVCSDQGALAQSVLLPNQQNCVSELVVLSLSHVGDPLL